MQFVKSIDKAAAKWLPPLTYCKLQDFIRPAMQPGRRGGLRRKVSISGKNLKVEWGDGTKMHFVYPRRYGRYIHPLGRVGIFQEMLSKYQDGEAAIRQGDAVVDIGANVGEFSLAAVTLLGASKVYAFEPDPTAFAALRENLEGSPVEAIQSAAGQASGSVEFFLSTSSADSSVIPPSSWTDRVKVPVERIDKFVSSNGIKVDFLKIEAEGYEPEVLAGCGDVLGKVRVVAVDCGPERYGQTTFDECEAILHRYGFRTWHDSRGQFVLYAVKE